MVIVGAQCFYDERNSITADNTQYINQLIDRLDQKEIKYTLVVVAEEYKRLDNQLIENDYFRRDHLDQIDLFLRNKANLIITNKPLVNNWEAMLKPESMQKAHS